MWSAQERVKSKSQNKEGRKDIVDVAFIPPALFIQMKLFSLFNI
jgi:hypothetical protein